MTTATFDTPFDYGSLSEAGLLRSVLLAAVVHGLLFAFLFYGLRWQSEPPGAETVELYVPPPAPATVPVVEPAPPKPQPIVEKDPELTPVQKPDIAVEKETPKKPVKPDPPKAKAEPKADPKKPDFSRELDKDLRKDPRSDMMAQLDKEKVGTTKGANDAALGVWKSKVAAKARARMRDFGDINPNLSAVITVTVLPNFEVLNAKVTRTSGDPAFDAAAERAVVAASPLPLPETPEAVGRSFTFTFRAR